MPDLIRGNLTVLAADVEMQRGARAFLRKVVRPTFSQGCLMSLPLCVVTKESL